MKILVYMVHCVETMLPTFCFYEKWSVYSALNWVFFLFMVPPVCQQIVDSGESGIKEPQSFPFIYQKGTYMNKNKISCQGCSRNITSGHQIFKSNNMTISLIISNRVPKFIMPFYTHPSHSYSIEVIHYSSCPHSQK